MLNSPFLQHAADLVKDYLKFMDDHLKESADLTCLSYRHRTYSKVSRCPFYCSPIASAILHGIHVKKHIVELIYAPSIINKNGKSKNRKSVHDVFNKKEILEPYN